MEWKKRTCNVLVLDTGTQGYVFVKALHKSGHIVFLLYRGKHNYADDSRYVDVKIQTKASHEEPEYLETVKSIITENKIDTVIPMSDFSSHFLSKNKEVLSPMVSYVLPSIDIFERGYDKNSLMALCAKNGYPHPQTVNGVSSLDWMNIGKLNYPLLIKPNHTCGGRGMTLVRNKEELEALSHIFLLYGFIPILK